MKKSRANHRCFAFNLSKPNNTTELSAFSNSQNSENVVEKKNAALLLTDSHKTLNVVVFSVTVKKH
jgi:hypothetical protein